MDVKRFKQQPLLGILRGITADMVGPLIESVFSAGLETIEITMNTEGAPQLIAQAVKASRKKLTIGAGTVLSMKDLRAALQAGATFIVMPVVVEDVIRFCVKNKIPVFPGALTPQEIYTAWNLGATMVKVFPAKCFGPEYFKEIRGPFGNIALLACSGVTPETMCDYFKNGASAISFGASVFRNEWLKKKDFNSITNALKDYTNRWETVKKLL
jgi:2-dehydro-3-deoxyphosphogluconate aldolase / (4S)-4-hydroxy-2-oxoglutarate aldolase